MNDIENMIGKRYGKLTIIDYAEPFITSNNVKYVQYKCKCDCGNEIIVRKITLNSNRKISCGCVPFNPKKQSEIGKHIYDIYKQMTHRCYGKTYKDYKNYGERGIGICKEWYDFEQDYNLSKNRFTYNDQRYENFYNWAINTGYSYPLTLDRIDVNGNYEPQNCRWATIKQQSNNKRTSRYIEINGEKHTVSEWSEIQGFSSRHVILERLNLGWTEIDAILTPVNQYYKKK